MVVVIFDCFVVQYRDNSSVFQNPNNCSLRCEMAPPNCPVSDLREYLAVPGKLIKIPGTEYVLITPISEEAASSAAPAPPLSAQIRRRGRPAGKTTPCQCPNCKVGNVFLILNVNVFLSVLCYRKIPSPTVISVTWRIVGRYHLIIDRNILTLSIPDLH